MTIVAEHSSGLHSVEPAVLKVALTKQLADEPDFLSLTEMMSEARAAVLFQLPGYAVARAKGPDGEDECAALVKRSSLPAFTFRVHRLSHLPIPRRSGKFCDAMVVTIVASAIGPTHTRIIIHLPSGVEDDLREGRTGPQVDVYRDAIEGLKRLVASIDGPAVITGDWNISERNAWVRDYLAKHFPEFTPTWRADNLPELGTLGPRLIDFSLVRGFTVVAADVVPSFGASDHRAIRETHKETTMGGMPGAVWLGEHSPGRLMTRYDIVCVHTIVGFAPAHAAHFSVKADGTILQSRDTRFRSGANLEGNPRVIAIENEDHGPAFGGTPRLPEWVPLTDAQVEANARILRWAHEVHGIPLQLCPNSKPTSRGLAYHRQGIDGNFDSHKFPGRVEGGEVWTTSFGKVCPTDVRIAQLPEILALAINPEGDEMSWTENLPKWYPGDTDKTDQLTAGNQLAQARGYAQEAQRSVARVEKAVAALAAALGPKVEAAVAAALKDAVIDVDINVNDGTP